MYNLKILVQINQVIGINVEKQIWLTKEDTYDSH